MVQSRKALVLELRVPLLLVNKMKGRAILYDPEITFEAEGETPSILRTFIVLSTEPRDITYGVNIPGYFGFNCTCAVKFYSSPDQ